MKKLIFILLLVTNISFGASLSTIIVPDLTVTNLESDTVGLSDLVNKNIPKFSAQIRGALIKSGDFRVVQDNYNQESNISMTNVYYLIGDVNYIGQNEDSYPISETNNITKQYFIEVEADFKVIRVSDNTVMANFSVTGNASDVKIVSTVNKPEVMWHHNMANLVQSAATDLANNVVNEMEGQLNFTIKNEKKHKVESLVVTDVKVYH